MNHHLILRKIGHLTGTDAGRIDAGLRAVLFRIQSNIRLPSIVPEKFQIQLSGLMSPRLGSLADAA